MTRNFDRNLTIMVAGSGNVTMKHLEDNLGDWMFPSPDAERDVTVILPLFSDMGPGIRNLIKLGLTWEFEFIVIQSKNAPMTRELSALSEDCFTHVESERDALQTGLEMLTGWDSMGNETAFIMAHNPKSTYEQGNPALSDFDIIGEAKNRKWLTTLNLCEGLVDSFEGYESSEDRLKREQLQKDFEDEKRAEEATKPATKKAVAPRKRAAKKAVAPVANKPVEEPEKPLQDVPVGTVVEVGGMEFTKKGPNPFREPLPTGNVLSAEIPLVIGKTAEIQDTFNELYVNNPNDFRSTEEKATEFQDVWSEVTSAHARVEKRGMIQVSKIDLAQLSTDIKELTTAFGNIMDTFTRILKDG